METGGSKEVGFRSKPNEPGDLHKIWCAICQMWHKRGTHVPTPTPTPGRRLIP